MNNPIRDNLAIVEQLKRSEKIIFDSQLEEAVRQLTKKSEKLSPAGALEYFGSNFGACILSPQFGIFCKCLFENGLCDCALPAVPPGRCKIAYIKNPVADSAISMLCADRGNEYTKVSYSSFRLSCEAVCDGEADYCLLPHISTDEGSFASFYRLTKSYDLKLCRECTVIRDDGENEMRFALMGRRLEYTGCEKHMSFSYLPQEDDLADVMQMITVAGGHVIFVNSTPLEYSIDNTECTLTLRHGVGQAPLFMFMLEAALPSCTVSGIYNFI